MWMHKMGHVEWSQSHVEISYGEWCWIRAGETLVGQTCKTTWYERRVGHGMLSTAMAEHVGVVVEQMSRSDGVYE